MGSHALKIFGQTILDIAYFPLWWYSQGLLKVLRFLKSFLLQKEKSLAFLVWVKNIFTPMYGQRDVAGFLISFFMRLVQIIFRGLVLLFWLAFVLGVLLFYILLPLMLLYQIIYQII